MHYALSRRHVFHKNNPYSGPFLMLLQEELNCFTVRREIGPNAL